MSADGSGSTKGGGAAKVAAQSLWDKAAAALRGKPEVARAGQAVAASRVRAKETASGVDAVRLEAARQAAYDTAIKATQLVAAGGFPGYAAEKLKIKGKDGQKVPFRLNRAQQYVHDMAERQISVRGYVRIIVLKGRQMGVSTYILGRGYYRTTRQSGQSAYILTHEVKATNNLFGILKRFHNWMDPRFRPSTSKSNEQELIFNRLGGGYAVGTAKTGETGRSLTVQFFHGSEAAFWPMAKKIVAGLFQAIALAPGTEVWIESTANGVGNFFHSQVEAARKGENTDYELAFCPWFWDPQYTTPEELVPPDWAASMTLEDLEYQQLWDLSNGQMHWRAKKIQEFAVTEGNDVEAGRVKFQQEYPATVEEAFMGDAKGAFIKAARVVIARKAYREESKRLGGARPVGHGPLILGIDPSHVGGDKFSVWARRGRVAWKIDSWQKQKVTESYGRLLAILDREQPDEVYIDHGHIGGALYDMLSESPWGGRVTAVGFGDQADEPERYENKRCEIWDRMRTWLGEAPQAMLQDLDAIQSDLCAVLTKRDTTGTRVKLESKDDMRARDINSPDDGDALALTFAYGHVGPRSGGRAKRPDPRRSSFLGPGMGRG